jgi:hypothetical protein
MEMDPAEGKDLFFRSVDLHRSVGQLVPTVTDTPTTVYVHGCTYIHVHVRKGVHVHATYDVRMHVHPCMDVHAYLH